MISSTTILSCSRGSVGKFVSTILRSEKLTRRSSSATLVSDSPLSVPSAGLAAPFDGVRHRRVQRHVLLSGPVRDLRLIDHEGGAAGRRVGARPAAVGRRHGGCGFRGRGLRCLRRCGRFRRRLGSPRDERREQRAEQADDRRHGDTGSERRRTVAHWCAKRKVRARHLRRFGPGNRRKSGRNHRLRRGRPPKGIGGSRRAVSRRRSVGDLLHHPGCSWRDRRFSGAFRRPPAETRVASPLPPPIWSRNRHV